MTVFKTSYLSSIYSRKKKLSYCFSCCLTIYLDFLHVFHAHTDSWCSASILAWFMLLALPPILGPYAFGCAGNTKLFSALVALYTWYSGVRFPWFPPPYVNFMVPRFWKIYFQILFNLLLSDSLTFLVRTGFGIMSATDFLSSSILVDVTHLNLESIMYAKFLSTCTHGLWC